MNATKDKVTLPPVVEGPESRHYFFEFESVSHLLDVANLRGVAVHPGNVVFSDQRAQAGSKDGRGWDGASIPAMLGWMRQMPQHLLDAIEAVKSEVEALVEVPMRGRRKLRRNREEGDELDPQAVLERRPDGWTEVDSVRVPKNVIKIAANLALSAGHRPEHLMYRGAAVAAIADLLTERGYSVEVVLFEIGVGVTGRGYDRLCARCVVKAAGDPLDIGAVAVSLGEVGFLRTAMFAAEHRVYPEKGDGGCGMVGGLLPREKADIDVLLDADVMSLSGAVRKVLETMARFTKE